MQADRKSTRLNSSHLVISYAVFCLKKKKTRLNSSTLVISYAVFCLEQQGSRLSRVCCGHATLRLSYCSLVFRLVFFFFFFNDTATTEIYPLSLHDALPI